MKEKKERMSSRCMELCNGQLFGATEGHLSSGNKCCVRVGNTRNKSERPQLAVERLQGRCEVSGYGSFKPQTRVYVIGITSRKTR